MQAQDYSPASWSIAQRALGLVPKDIDAALASGSIIRTHVLRPTWHFVAREDLRWLLTLTGPRVQQGNASRYRQLGLDARTFSRCETAIVDALRGGNTLRRDAIAGVLDEAGIDREGQRLPHILGYCELEAVICSGGLDGKQQTYALVDERVPKGRSLDHDDALVELARRYLASHGPASVKDLRWWSSLKVADIRKAFELLGDEVHEEQVDGVELWAMADHPNTSRRKQRAHLLQKYDELIVGYTETRYLGDPHAQETRATWGDRGAAAGIVQLDGRLAGYWRRTIGRTSVDVEVHVYEALTKVREAIESGVEELGRFLGRAATLELKRLVPD